MTNIDNIQIFLAGANWADVDPATGLAPLLERGETIKAASLVLVWVADDGAIAERALVDACFAARHGVPYGVASNLGIFRNENTLLFNHGAQLVLSDVETVQAALPLAAACVYHNPKGDRIWPFDAGAIVSLLAKCESPIEERCFDCSAGRLAWGWDLPTGLRGGRCGRFADRH
jgi:hypothetical protein